ncbi:MAG: hypothetical protein D6689_04795 [Deltaproteobacteria bacterium]|nr:MAG: hypothetical protein D6689_04795 [Deltaproteobacteria bacterium]
MQQKVRPNPHFDPVRHGALTHEDYFVLTRIDGMLTVREVILETGFPVARAIDIVRKLKRCGAFLLPHERPYTPRPAATAAAAPSERAAAAAPSERTRARAAGPAEGAPSAVGTEPPSKRMLRAPLAFADLSLTAEERAALDDDSVALSREDRERVLVLLRTIERGTLFDVLGVSPDADKKTLKRAYFRVSKQFHPDRYYGKHTGAFGPWLSRIFEAASRAFDVLSDDAKRAEYLDVLAGRPPSGRTPRAQTHAEHARELFAKAEQLEAAGERIEALKYMAGAIRVDPQARYLRRAALCAQAAGQLSLAEEYAKKAAGLEPDDPSCARVLAQVLRAAGKLSDAQRTLEHALALNRHNDQLHTELERELQAVRSELATRR